ncbi:hypothetical protein AVEN_69583-1, partial [Araneus ventricosus]
SLRFTPTGTVVARHQARESGCCPVTIGVTVGRFHEVPHSDLWSRGDKTGDRKKMGLPTALAFV